jgi:hypothetical protein
MLTVEIMAHHYITKQITDDYHRLQVTTTLPADDTSVMDEIYQTGL